MDKTTFLKRAPEYYALAIVSYLTHYQDGCMSQQIEDHFCRFNDEDDPTDRYYPVKRGKLFDIAINLLQEQGLITLERDDFGPSLIRRTEVFSEVLGELEKKPESIYNLYLQRGQYRELWLREALSNLEDYERNLVILDSDYEEPENEWSPIPVDRGQSEVRAMMEAIEDATEKIRSDNGYSATRPEERNYVIDGLTTFGGRLKNAATISMPYIRQYAMDPIARAAKSLGKSISGLAIEVVKARIKDWLMKQGIPWPHDWP